MSRPTLIGITGGIGAGKSVVTEIFKLLGTPVYDADSRAKRLMTEDPGLVEAITNTFGPDSYVNGTLNRTYLAEKVFSSEEETLKLNALVHPAVARDFCDWVDRQTSPYVLKEAALLFESESYKELDKVILVTAPEDLRIKRVQVRDSQRSVGQIRNIIKRQMDPHAAMKLAHEILNNDETSLLVPQIISLDNKIKKAIN